MLAELKKHPYVIAGAIIGVIALFLLSSSGSSTTATTADDSSDVGAAEALQQAQLAAQTQVSGQQAQLADDAQNDAANISIANIQAGVTNNANSLAAGVAAQQITAQEDEENTANTLQAQTTQYLANQQTQQYAISSNTQIQTTQLLTNALLGEAQISAQATENATNAAETVATQSWFSKIF